MHLHAPVAGKETRTPLRRMNTQHTALDHYRVLELPYGASHTEIQRAFRRLAKLHHPDRQQGMGDHGARFREIVASYEYLKTYIPHQQRSENSHAENYPDSELFSEAFRQMRARRIRIHPRRAPRERRRGAAEGGMRYARPRLFLVRPPSNDYYYIYIFYLGSIGFIIIMIIWNILTSVFQLGSDKEPSASPPSYTLEEKATMLEIFEESEQKKVKNSSPSAPLIHPDTR